MGQFDLKAKMLREFAGHLNERYRTPLAVLRRDDSETLVAGSEDGSVHLWDVKEKSDWKQELRAGVTMAVDAMDDLMAVAGFNPDGAEEWWMYLLKIAW